MTTTLPIIPDNPLDKGRHRSVPTIEIYCIGISDMQA